MTPNDSSREDFEATLTSREALQRALADVEAAIDAVVAEAGEQRAIQTGAFEELSLKDVVAHLTGWRELTAARLEAGLSGAAPAHPWPDGYTEDDDLDAINRWFYERDRDKPLAAIMAESADTFARCRRAVAALSEDALFTAGRFDWLDGYPLMAVVSGTCEHFFEDHEAEIRAWLAAG